MTLAVVVVLVVVVGFGYPYVHTYHRSPDADYSRAPNARFIGSGARWVSSSSWPMLVHAPVVSLSVYTWGLRIGSRSRGYGWIVPLIELPWQEIESIYRRRSGLLVVREGRPKRSVLFNGHRDEILEALRDLPVKIR